MAELQSSNSAPSVAVIGGGWYGCHITHVLKNRGFNVVLIEKADSLFSGASGKNQFRLHAGFHYPRSSLTRSQISNGLKEFRERLPTFFRPLQRCIYAVSATESLVDFGTYKEVFEATGVPFEEVHPQTYGLTNVEGCIDTKEEMYFFVDAPREFYQEQLADCMRLNCTVTEVLNRNIDGKQGVFVNSEWFDFCINCTYNQLNPISATDCFYEVCLTLLYRQKVKQDDITGITIMDGNFCSLYPYVLNAEDLENGDSRRYTLTHVKYTPLMQSKDFKEAEAFLQGVKEELVRAKAPLFEAGFAKFYPSFKSEFEYDGWFVSMKTKPLDAGAANHTASRECIAERDGNSIRVLSGKINTLFEAERMILAELLGDWSKKISREL